MTGTGTMPEEYYFLGYTIARLTPEKGKWNTLGHRYLSGFVKHCIRNIGTLNSYYFENIGVETEKEIDKRAYNSLKGLRDEFWHSGVPKPSGYSETEWGSETADYHTKQIQKWKNKSNDEVKQALQELYSIQQITEAQIELLPEGLPAYGETLFIRSRDPSGWLYVVTNPKWQRWVKIGVSRNLKKRLSSYNTSSPHKDYIVEWHKFHENSIQVEAFIHNLSTLNSIRGESKEWYNLSVQKCIPILEEVFRKFDD